MIVFTYAIMPGRGMIRKEWDAIVKTGGAKANSRKKRLRRMWNVSELMRKKSESGTPPQNDARM